MRIRGFILLVFSVLFINNSTFGQHIAVKSNMLYDASATFNLGLEFKLNTRLTMDVPVNYNPWTFSDNKKMKHILVQPEIRFWNCEAFYGHFWGIHAHYAYYNIGGIGPFTTLKNNRYEGWLAGGGVTYGYHWILSNRWSLEASVGAGYAFVNYEKYECKKCGEKLSDGTKHYFGPTKAGISLIYFF